MKTIPNIGNIYTYEKTKDLKIPFFAGRITAGFPSPAEDHLDNSLDLNDLLISHPAATFFIRVEGNSMERAGIFSGDLLVVNRALEAKDGNIIVAVLRILTGTSSSTCTTGRHTASGGGAI